MKILKLILLFVVLHNFTAVTAELSDLPPELRGLILKDATIADILKFCAASKDNQNLCDGRTNQYFWELLVQRDFKENHLGTQGPTLSWKDIYILNYESGKPSTVALGLWHTCAIKNDKSLRCWGDRNSSEVPKDLGPVTAVSAGSSHTCAIKVDGTVECFGSFSWPYLIFVPEQLGKVKAIASGSNHVCAIKADDTLECWGASQGQKYTPEYKGLGEAIVPSDLGTVKAVASAFEHTCAIKTDGTLVCFGTKWMPKIPENIGKVIAVKTNHVRTCVIKKDNNLACFFNHDRLIDLPKDLGKVKNVAVGINHICVIKADDTLACFGKGKAANVPPDLGKVKDVVAGGEKTCAVTVSGNLRCFGDHAVRGELKVPKDLPPVLTR